MKLYQPLVVVIATCAWLPCVGSAQALQPSTEDSDRGTVYRIQPSVEGVSMVAVTTGEIKPGLAYNYYNTSLGRRVWSFATEDGSFQYAFGQGTTLPIDRFDFRIASAERAEILERRAPELLRDMEISGGLPAVQLDAEGQWRLIQRKSPARVFDLETGQRWEWHGGRRKAVLHTGGNLWQIVDGHYEPATAWFAAMPCGCN